jgi:lipoate-protein ligase A
MFHLDTCTGDPFYNLACEDWLLHNHTGEFLILGINDPSVIVGKHQIVHREVNTRFTDENNIPVIRRISGGGTVWHDRGNLNFSFIRNSEKGKQIDFRYYTMPVIEFLRSEGVDAVFEGKSDIRVDGMKISGNAEHIFRERVLHHGTLLFDASFENMRKAIRPAGGSYETHAVESNRTKVANLRERLNGIADISEFKDAATRYFSATIPSLEKYNLSGSEREAINNLAGSKYRTWAWNWGYAPRYVVRSQFKANSVVHSARLMVKDGIIWECDLEGSPDVFRAGKQLIGYRHMFGDVISSLRSADIDIADNEAYKLF